MEDPNLIATLIPVDKEKRSEFAFCLKENHKRYLPPIRVLEDGPVISSREVTPAQDHFDDGHCKYDSTHRLQLSFDEIPKDPSKGFSFGTDPKSCDILLGSRGVHQISGLHFYITFDDTIDDKKHLILRDSSTNGTAVSYSDQARESVRHHFTWILDLRKREGNWDVEVHVRGLSFKIELASHETCKAEYDKKVEAYLKDSRKGLPSLDVLGIDSYTTTAQPSQSLTPKQFPIYIRERNLGSGSFGQVDKVLNVSTGAIYARKIFYEPPWGKNQKDQILQREDWLSGVRREVRIMRENSHQYTVQVEDFREHPRPFMVMPYLPLGNLEDMHCESPIAVEETVDLCFQALTALQYLHPRGVAHRDLKPENILVCSRDPLHIKLADFGLANDKPNLQTFCGTMLYAAPETYSQGTYTVLVDLWSLGIIILQYVYGFPGRPKAKKGRHRHSQVMKECGLDWCQRVVEFAMDWESERLIDLITLGMLRMDPGERLSANVCIMKGHESGLFDGQPVEVERNAPTRQTAALGDDNGNDGSASILVDALWDTKQESTDKFVIRSGSFALKNDLEVGNLQSSPESLASLETRLEARVGHKRRRPATVGVTLANPSDTEPTRRRSQRIRLTQRCVQPLSL